MSTKQVKKTSTKRLSPNDRARLIMDYESGKELSDPNYYVIKDKNGKINVRRKKESSDSGSGEDTKKKSTKTQKEQTSNGNPGPAKEYDDTPEKEEKPKAL